MDADIHTLGRKNGKTACGLSAKRRPVTDDTDDITCERCKPKPKTLRDRGSRERARHVRDNQWRFTERCAEHETFWFCVWNKNRRDEAANEWRDALMTGMEIQDWMHRHSDWFSVGEWDDDRYAVPVKITDAGRSALEDRDEYDMEPVYGGMVEPGWKCVPIPTATST